MRIMSYTIRIVSYPQNRAMKRKMKTDVSDMMAAFMVKRNSMMNSCEGISSGY